VLRLSFACLLIHFNNTSKLGTLHVSVSTRLCTNIVSIEISNLYSFEQNNLPASGNCDVAAILAPLNSWSASYSVC
jgi:hypothetical protein